MGELSVLVVEDNPADAALICRMLSREKFRTVHVSTLSACLKEMEANPADVILLDLGLPDSFGLATLDKARAAAREPAIIVISGMSEKEIAVEALRRGAEDFFAKECVDGQLLSRAIHRSISQRAQTRAFQSTAPLPSSDV